MTESILQKIESYLAERKQQGLYRTRVVTDSKAQWLDFSCNDYLSFAKDERVREAYQRGFERYPVGSGGSMVLCGYHDAHRSLEQAFAQALGVDDCLLFSSGYVANLSVVSLLVHFGMHVVVDKSVHASIYDGLGLANARYTRFLHNNTNDLQKKLEKLSTPAAILTESTFSMSGLHAPLKNMADLARQYSAPLLVDEAHGFGVIGPNGLGGVMDAQLNQEDVPLRMIPFGKAMNGSGAIVAGKSAWIDALLQATRQPVYSTAMSPGFAHGLEAVLNLVKAANDRRAHLQSLIQYFRQAAQASALQWRDSISPIQQLQLGCPFKATTYTDTLAANQIRCFPIRQPTVSKQETGLRIILNYQHSLTDIDSLFQVLNV